MQKRTLGNSNLEVSDIGLGRMGMSYSYAPFPDKQKMIALIRSVVEPGTPNKSSDGRIAERATLAGTVGR